jgi:hypothetical protein
MAPKKTPRGNLAAKKDFIKVGDGFVGTTWYVSGQSIRMTDEQAKYPAIYGWIVRPTDPVAKAAAPKPLLPKSQVLR